MQSRIKATLNLGREFNGDSTYEDFEELTRCKMCMEIAFFYSQEEVHRISGSSTKKKNQ